MRASTAANAESDASIEDASSSVDAAATHSAIVEGFNAADGTRCVLTADGEVVQWTHAPPKARWHIVKGLHGVTRIGCSDAVTCGQGGDGTWSCAGNRFFASIFPPDEMSKIPLEDIDAVVPYLDGVCAVGHGSLYCWGNLGGHVAVGDAPTRIALVGVVKFVDSGNGWSLIGTRRGDVYCWGRNYEGVCGPGTWDAFGAPRRIATGVVDFVASSESSTLLRKDGIVLTSGHVGFNTPRRKEHKPTEPEGDDFFYSDVPIPLSLPGRVRRLLGDQCFELESGEAGCLLDRWYPRSIEELKPCRAEDGVVKCGEKVVPLSW